MIKTKNVVKGLFAMLVCGISAINLFPPSSYINMVSYNTESITKDSWSLTGKAMKKAIDRFRGELTAKV